MSQGVLGLFEPSGRQFGLIERRARCIMKRAVKSKGGISVVVFWLMFVVGVCLAEEEDIGRLFEKALVADPCDYAPIQEEIINRDGWSLVFLGKRLGETANWYERAITEALILRIALPKKYEQYQKEFDEWARRRNGPSWTPGSVPSHHRESVLVKEDANAVAFLIERLFKETLKRIADRTVVGWHESRPVQTAAGFLKYIGGKDAARAVAVILIDGVAAQNDMYDADRYFHEADRSAEEIYKASRLSDKQLVDIMIQLLKKRDCVPIASWVLGEFGELRAVGSLIETFALYKRSFDVPPSYGGSYAVDALSRIGEPALPGLAKALWACDQQTYWGIKTALVKIGNVESGVLRESLRKGEPLAREQALLSIAIMGGKSAVKKSLEEVWPGSVEDEEALKVLVGSLIVYDYKVVGVIGDILAEAGEKAIPFLIEGLSSSHLETRSAASSTLRKIGPVAIPFIERVVDEKDHVGHYYAVRALRFVADPQGVPVLIKALEGSDLGAVHEAAIALGEMGDPVAREPLLRALEDPKNLGESGRALFGIAGALAKFKEVRAFDKLAELSRKDDWLIRRAAIKALPAVGGEKSMPILLEMVKHEYKSTRGDAAIALGKLGDSRAVPALIEALSDSESFVFSWAAWSLGEIGDARALPYLRKMASETKGHLQRTANEAIGKIKAANSD